MLKNFCTISSKQLWAGSDDEDEDASDWEVGSQEGKAQEAEERAKKERGKAGLPELELDQLPSAIAPKMLILVFEKNTKTLWTKC